MKAYTKLSVMDYLYIIAVELFVFFFLSFAFKFGLIGGCLLLSLHSGEVLPCSFYLILRHIQAVSVSIALHFHRCSHVLSAYTRALQCAGSRIKENTYTYLPTCVDERVLP